MVDSNRRRVRMRSALCEIRAASTWRVGLILLAFSLAACGSGAGTPTTSAGSPQSQTPPPVSTPTPIPGPITGEFGTFTATGEMTMARSAHQATRLRDGKVLITGGSSVASGSNSVAAAEIYDPSSRAFTRTGDMNVARGFGHSATLLADGTVLVAGGIGGTTSREALNSAELYDPATGTFASVGDMLMPQFMQAAILLPNGKVLIAGGQASASPGIVIVAGAEVYDPATRSFAATGGYSAPNSLTPSVQGSLWPVATLLLDGTVLVSGNNPAELYEPVSGTFRIADHMRSREYRYGMYWHTSTMLTAGNVLIAGGTDDLLYIASAELYDYASGTFTATGKMNQSRGGHTATLMSDGRVLIAGGAAWIQVASRGVGTDLASTEFYDPVLGGFVPNVSMLRARVYHTATLLDDGTVLIAGGTPFAPPSAELFIPK